MADQEVTGPANGMADSEILTIEDVSRILHCSVDTLRRVPVSELPFYRVGKRNLYLRDDIIRFIRMRRVERPNIDNLLEEITSAVDCDSEGMVDFNLVGVRGLPARKTT